MRYFSVKRVKTELLKSKTSPRVTALSLAIGVGVAFSPFPGLHILLGFILIKALRLNSVVSVVGILVHNPWTMFFIHLAGLSVGDLLTSGSLRSFHAFEAFPWSELSLTTAFSLSFWQSNGPVLRVFLWPFLVGSLVLSGVMGFTSYQLSFRFLAKHMKRHHEPTDVK